MPTNTKTMNNPCKSGFTINQVRDYVEGWLSSDCDKKNLTMNEIVAMLNNALVTVECPDDGLAAYVERQKYYARHSGH